MWRPSPRGRRSGSTRAGTGHTPTARCGTSCCTPRRSSRRSPTTGDRWAHIDGYDDFVPFLTFDEFDPDAWTELALGAGMDYAVIVAKHHDGWCWWDAPGTERTLVDAGPRRNVLGEFAAACERADLAFGTYYSLLDWADDRYGDCAHVDQIVHPQVVDLVERYGSRLLWGDGHWGGGESHWRSDELIGRCLRIEPELVINDRWWWNGPGVASYEYRLPTAILRSPWEHRRGLGGSLSYNRTESDEHLMSGPGIIALLTEVLAKGGHLLLSVGPDAQGAIPASAGRLTGVGEWVRAHRTLVDSGEPWDEWGDDDRRYLVVDGVLHAVDVGGTGVFPAIGRRRGAVTSVTSMRGERLAFEQDDGGLRVERRGVPGRWPDVFRIEIADAPSEPIALFGDSTSPSIELADVIGDAQPGDIVQLGDGTYIGPARIPDGVCIRGLGPDRTRLDGFESAAVVLGADSRLEHCAVAGGGERIVWLPHTAVSVVGDRATVIGCRVDGHIDIEAGDVKVRSCELTGIVARNADQLTIARCHFSGMNWDCGVDLQGGANQLVESSDFTDLLIAIRCTGTVGTVVRNNSAVARWWGVQLIDGESAHVSGNAFEKTMRAVDVDGGTLAEVSGNAVILGDSGCVVQGGATDCTVSGNYWERCRIGLLAWDAGALRHSGNAAVDLAEPDGAYVVGP